MVYILSFAIALFIFKLSEFAKPKVAVCMLFLAILAPSYVAGIRAVGVGFDTALYGETAYLYSLNHSAIELIQLYKNDSPLFYAMWHFFSSQFKTMAAPQFATEFIIEMSLLLVLVKEKKKNRDFHIWMGMAVYYFIFYAYSLNIMRQSIALAFVLVGYQYFLTENKYLKYVVWTFVTMMIHTSAVIAFLVLFLYVLYNRFFEATGKRRFFYITASLVGVGAFLMLYTKIIEYIALVVPRYSHYMSTKIQVRSTFDALSLFMMVTCAVFVAKWFVNRRRKVDFYEYLTILGIPVFLINLFSNDTYRLSFYLLYCLILTCPSGVTVWNKNNKIAYQNSRCLRPLLLCVLFLFWYVMFVKWGTNDVIPFRAMT